jgi:hypothetical protein
MSYFTHHVFFCCNQRAEGETCCANHDAVELQTYAKDRIGALGLNGKGQIRINKAGCLGRCDDGPVLVVYPTNLVHLRRQGRHRRDHRRAPAKRPRRRTPEDLTMAATETALINGPAGPSS